MQRCIWRGIEAETIEFELNDEIDFSKLDIVLLGGGSDREQMIVCRKLKDIQQDFKSYVEDNGVVIAVCGGYQLLGKYYRTEEGMIEGLDLVDLYTEQGEGRLIGNIVLKATSLRHRWWDLKITAAGRLSERTPPSGRCSTDMEMRRTADARAWSTKTSSAPICTALFFRKIPRSATGSSPGPWRENYGSGVLVPLDDSQELEANRYIYAVL